MKRLAKLFRFLCLLFFLFLAVTLCFVLNKVLDKSITQNQTEALESLQDFN